MAKKPPIFEAELELVQINPKRVTYNVVNPKGIPIDGLSRIIVIREQDGVKFFPDDNDFNSSFINSDIPANQKIDSNLKRADASVVDKMIKKQDSFKSYMKRRILIVEE